MKKGSSLAVLLGYTLGDSLQLENCEGVKARWSITVSLLPPFKNQISWNFPFLSIHHFATPVY